MTGQIQNHVGHPALAGRRSELPASDHCRASPMRTCPVRRVPTVSRTVQNQRYRLLHSANSWIHSHCASPLFECIIAPLCRHLDVPAPPPTPHSIPQEQAAFLACPAQPRPARADVRVVLRRHRLSWASRSPSAGWCSNSRTIRSWWACRLQPADGAPLLPRHSGGHHRRHG